MKYRILNEIPDMEWNTGYGMKYRIWNEIADLEWNSGYGMKYRIWNEIADMEWNTGYMEWNCEFSENTGYGMLWIWLYSL